MFPELYLQIAANEIHDLWMEYEEGASLEAKVVKDFDKVRSTSTLFPTISILLCPLKSHSLFCAIALRLLLSGHQLLLVNA